MGRPEPTSALVQASYSESRRQVTRQCARPRLPGECTVGVMWTLFVPLSLSRRNGAFAGPYIIGTSGLKSSSIEHFGDMLRINSDEPLTELHAVDIIPAQSRYAHLGSKQRGHGRAWQRLKRAGGRGGQAPESSAQPAG